MPVVMVMRIRVPEYYPVGVRRLLVVGIDIKHARSRHRDGRSGQPGVVLYMPGVLGVPVVRSLPYYQESPSMSSMPEWVSSVQVVYVADARRCCSSRKMPRSWAIVARFGPTWSSGTTCDGRAVVRGFGLDRRSHVPCWTSRYVRGNLVDVVCPCVAVAQDKVVVGRG